MANHTTAGLNYRPKPLGSFTYAASSRRSMDIDREGVAAQYNLRLQFTITNSATPPVGVRFQALARLLRRVEVILQGRDTVVAIDGAGLAALATYETGQVPLGMGDTVVLTGSAVTVYNVVLPLPRFLPRGISPDDASDDLRGLSQAQLVVEFGDASDIFNTPNGAVVSAVTCEVEAEYVEGYPSDRVFLLRNLDMTEIDIPATQSDLSVLLDKGTNVWYRNFLLLFTVDEIGANNVLNSVSLQQGSKRFQLRREVFLRGHTMRRYGVASFVTGAYALDVTQYGRGSFWLPASGPADMKLLLDVTKQTGTNRLRVYREAVRPIKL